MVSRTYRLLGKIGLSEADAFEYAGDVVWPTCVRHVRRNSRVIVCILLQNLVENRSLKWEEGNIQDACMRYRRFMADQLYAGRYV